MYACVLAQKCLLLSLFNAAAWQEQEIGNSRLRISHLILHDILLSENDMHNGSEKSNNKSRLFSRVYWAQSQTPSFKISKRLGWSERCSIAGVICSDRTRRGAHAPKAKSQSQSQSQSQSARVSAFALAPVAVDLPLLYFLRIHSLVRPL